MRVNWDGTGNAVWMNWEGTRNWTWTMLCSFAAVTEVFEPYFLQEGSHTWASPNIDENSCKITRLGHKKTLFFNMNCCSSGPVACELRRAYQESVWGKTYVRSTSPTEYSKSNSLIYVSAITSCFQVRCTKVHAANEVFLKIKRG